MLAAIRFMLRLCGSHTNEQYELKLWSKSRPLNPFRPEHFSALHNLARWWQLDGPIFILSLSGS